MNGQWPVVLNCTSNSIECEDKVKKKHLGREKVCQKMETCSKLYIAVSRIWFWK